MLTPAITAVPALSLVMSMPPFVSSTSVWPSRTSSLESRTAAASPGEGMTPNKSALAEIGAEGRENTVRFNKAAIEYGCFVCGRGVQAQIG